MPVSAQDRDAMIRTVMGEAGIEPPIGQAAVAHVILNRMATGRWGDNPTSVVKAKGQFEPWFTRRKELEGYDPQSPAYQRVAGVVDSVLSGNTPDPTGGATHFLEPTTVRMRRGGSLPPWAQGPGLRIGHHAFYLPPEMQNVSRETLAGKPQDAIASALGFLDKGQGATGTALPYTAPRGRSAAPVQGNPWDSMDIEDEIKNAPAPAPAKGTPAGKVEQRFPVPEPQTSANSPWSGIDLEKEIANAPETGKKQPVQPASLGSPQGIGETLSANPLLGTEFLKPELEAQQGTGIGPFLARHGIAALKGIGNLGESTIQGIGSLLSLAGKVPNPTPGLDLLGPGFEKERKAYEKRVAQANKEFSSKTGISEEIAQAAPSILPFLLSRGRLTSPQMQSAIARLAPRLGPTALHTAEAATAGGTSSALMSSRSERPLTEQAALGSMAGLFPAGFQAGSKFLKAIHRSPLEMALGTGLGAFGVERYHNDPAALQHDLMLAGLAALAAGAGKVGVKFPGPVGAAVGPQVPEITSLFGQGATK